MPATRTARYGDTVAYRNADGKYRNGTVIADTKAPTANWAISTATTGGTLAAATYSYRITWVRQGTETAPSTAKTQVTTGATSTVTLDVTGQTLPGATSWKVYGRTGGSELLMGTVTLPTLTFVDTGAVTPAGALTTDTGNVSIQMMTEPNKTNIGKTTTYKAVDKYFNR